MQTFVKCQSFSFIDRFPPENYSAGFGSSFPLIEAAM